MKTTRTFLALGIFLILAGLLGYLSNPAAAKTALISGGFFGTLFILCSVAFHFGFKFIRWVGLGVIVMLIPIFVWRSSASWLALAGGDGSKLIAALLITSMLLASIISGWLVWRHRSST